MTGIPQVQPFQPPNQYQQQQPQAAPQQYPQYAQPQMQPQVPPQQQGSDLGGLINKYKTELAEMKKLDRQKKRLEKKLSGEDDQPRQHRSNGQEAGFLTMGEPEDEEDFYEDFDTEELEGMLRRVKKGTREYREIQAILEDRKLAEEQLDLDELGDELEELVFHAVKVQDPSDDTWQMAEAKGTFDDVNNLVSSIRKRFPYSTKVKWGVVKRGGRTIESLSNRAFNLQSVNSANMKFAKDQQELLKKDKEMPQQPMFVPQPQQQMDLPGLIMAMAEQTKATQQTMMQMIAAMKDDTPKESDIDKLAKYQQIFVGPQIEMFKALQKGGGGGKDVDAFQMVNTMLGGAQKLANMGGGGGGGGDGILSTLLQAILPQIMGAMQGGQMQNFLPTPQQQPGQPQQQQQPQQLPPPSQQQPQPRPQPQPQQQPQGDQVQNPVLMGLQQKCRKIVEYMISGRLQLDQIPRYIYRNCAPEEGGLIFKMKREQFEQLLLGSVNRKDPTIAKFIGRDDVRRGAQWIHEEFVRLIRVMSLLAQQGDQQQADALAEWSAGVLVETEVVGEEAEKLFRERYDITEEDLRTLQGGEDLPDEGEDLPQEEPDDLPSGSETVPSKTKRTVVEEPKTPARQQKTVEARVEPPVRPAAPPVPRPRKKKKKPSFLKR